MSDDAPKPVRVAFRISLHHPECVAVFVDVLGQRADVMVYAHVGQHAQANIAWVNGHSRPATPAEYKDLMDELAQIYAPDIITPLDPLPPKWWRS